MYEIKETGKEYPTKTQVFSKQERQIAFVNALKAVDSMKDKYLVYDHFITPVELHYYGYTGKDIDYRIQCGYQKTALEPYINECGWDNINTTIVADGLTRKEAELLEDQLIREGWKRGDCINKQGSGGEWRTNRIEYVKKNSHKCYMNKQDYYKEQHKKYYQNHLEDAKEYRKQYYKEHSEELKNKYEKNKEEILKKRKEYYYKNKEIVLEYKQKQLSTPEGKIYNRVKSYNQRHPDKVIETPMEAKKKYLESGYIPSYIKNDDLVFDYNKYYTNALQDLAEAIFDMDFQNNDVELKNNAD